MEALVLLFLNWGITKPLISEVVLSQGGCEIISRQIASLGGYQLILILISKLHHN
jgi:hypothetical protein